MSHLVTLKKFECDMIVTAPTTSIHHIVAITHNHSNNAQEAIYECQCYYYHNHQSMKLYIIPKNKLTTPYILQYRLLFGKGGAKLPSAKHAALYFIIRANCTFSYHTPTPPTAHLSSPSKCSDYHSSSPQPQPNKPAKLLDTHPLKYFHCQGAP